MDRDEPRDLDAVIDDVARAMTSGGPARDLRPAVAARIAGAPSWTLGWRAAAAAAGAAAAAVVLAAVLMRPAPDQNRREAVVGAGDVRATVSTQAGEPELAAAPTGGPAGASGRTTRPVARQVVDDAPAIEEIVEIDPLAIVPLEDSDATESTLLSQQVEITPIDVEPVSISELEEVE